MGKSVVRGKWPTLMVDQRSDLTIMFSKPGTGMVVWPIKDPDVPKDVPGHDLQVGDIVVNVDMAPFVPTYDSFTFCNTLNTFRFEREEGTYENCGARRQ